jgi:hypothetical protein
MDDETLQDLIRIRDEVTDVTARFGLIVTWMPLAHEERLAKIGRALVDATDGLIFVVNDRERLLATRETGGRL